MSQQLQEYWPHDLVAGETVNVRPDDADVGDLVASIEAHGLLQPIVGRMREDGTVEIIDGNRRLKALKQLFDEERRRDRVPVMLRGTEPDADAYEISLAANVLRKPLHPVKEYEAFTALAEKGRSPQEIAEHFGISLRGVEQRLALGRLHEDVRQAWLEGRISGEAASALTLARPDEQASYLTGVTYPHELRADSIRRAFTHSAIKASTAAARFVGVEAYKAAGGEMLVDLFAEEEVLADRGLVERLAAEKLTQEAQRIAQEEGWAEVITENDPEANKRHIWDRLRKPALPDDQKPPRRIEIEERLRAIDERLEEIEGDLEVSGWDGDEETAPDPVKALLAELNPLEVERRELSHEHAQFDDDQAAWLSLPAEKRAKAIAIVGIQNDGMLAVMRGYLKGKAPKPEQRTALPRAEPKPAIAGEDERPEPARLSAALLDDLALTATKAAAFVLAEHPRVAFAALVATHAAYGSPIRFASQGRGEGPELDWKGRNHNNTSASFGAVFRAALAMPADKLGLQVARMISHTLDFTSKAILSHNYDSLKPDAAQDLRCALPAEQHRAALVQAFDADAYFTSAPKSEAIAAIAECGDDPGKHSKLKKGDLAAFAARLAKACAWLPPVLRGEIFEPTLPPPADESVPEAAAESIEPTAGAESAAEAAHRIWLDEERVRLEAMKTPAIRAEIKSRGRIVPFGATRNDIIDIALLPPLTNEEAA